MFFYVGLVGYQSERERDRETTSSSPELSGYSRDKSALSTAKRDGQVSVGLLTTTFKANTHSVMVSYAPKRNELTETFKLRVFKKFAVFLKNSAGLITNVAKTGKRLSLVLTTTRGKGSRSW